MCLFSTLPQYNIQKPFDNYEKYFFFYILLLLPIIGIAQTYKYIGVEDGLSNRRVYAIQKGPKGYMWFLTHDGIDRYNGKDFKPYKLMDGDEEVNSMMNLNWLYVDPKGTIWEIGKKDVCSAMIQNMTVLSWYTSYPKAK